VGENQSAGGSGVVSNTERNISIVGENQSAGGSGVVSNTERTISVVGENQSAGIFCVGSVKKKTTQPRLKVMKKYASL
jgi:hypothetical protein